MNPIHLKVTSDHIRLAEQARGSDAHQMTTCPIAQALWSAGFCNVRVGFYNAWAETSAHYDRGDERSGCMTFALDEVGKLLARRFTALSPVEPCMVTLTEGPLKGIT